MNIGESLSKYWRYTDTLTGQKPAMGVKTYGLAIFSPVTAMAATIALWTSITRATKRNIYGRKIDFWRRKMSIFAVCAIKK